MRGAAFIATDRQLSDAMFLAHIAVPPLGYPGRDAE